MVSMVLFADIVALSLTSDHNPFQLISAQASCNF